MLDPELGSDGSATSSLYQGREGPAAVDGWADDAAQLNIRFGEALGHRRNMLDPSITTMGAEHPATGMLSVSAEVVLTTPATTRPPVRDTFVAWPPAGFVPYQTVYPRWSFSVPNADFSHATVTMQHNGAGVPVTSGAWTPTSGNSRPAGSSVSRPSPGTAGVADGDSWPQPTADDPYAAGDGVRIHGRRRRAGADHLHDDGDRSGRRPRRTRCPHRRARRTQGSIRTPPIR